MAEQTFKSILDKQSSEVERPKPLPQGTYQCVVDGQPRIDRSTKKGTQFIEFALKPMAALDDVNEEDLNAALTSADGSVMPLADKRLRVTFYDTPNSEWRLQKFLENDLQMTPGKKKYSQLISEAQNREVLAYVKHVPSEDGQTLFANVASTSPIAE